jgi:hypothetical protein
MRKFIVALSAATGLVLMGASAAQASAGHSRPNVTPACGYTCFALSSEVLGTGTVQNAYIFGDTGVGGKVGKQLNLKFASNSHPNEDFSAGDIGTVGDFCSAWPAPQSFNPTSYVCIHYKFFQVYESNWSPFGNQSGLCAGVASAVNGENVTLRNCGASDNTLWIADRANGTGGDCRVTGDYCPWINGADTNFSHPLVLTVDVGTVHPANQLKVERLNLLTGGVGRDNQEFTISYGPVA